MPTEEILKIFEEKCRKGLHPFEKIVRYGPEQEEHVVRWCSVCGTIVIDIDVDGRTAPGNVMPARRPKILERN